MAGISATAYAAAFSLFDDGDDDDDGVGVDLVSRMRMKASEGSSGAFLFESRDHCYLVKSITHSEKNHLVKVAHKMASHFALNPATLIMRIYGCHSVTLSFSRHRHYFLVMENLFAPRTQRRIRPPFAQGLSTPLAAGGVSVAGTGEDGTAAGDSLVIHERYDIKGSTSANRTAKLPRKGQKLCCRHCNQLYRHREGNNQCTADHW
jgi:1-phosphatidylinositol-4-phosphate 5-kinase